jgi:hypothetical protein
MNSGVDLETRLRRLGTDLRLSREDQAALARLRGGSRIAQSNRVGRRAMAIPVVFAAVLLTAAVAFAASSQLSVLLRFHPSGWQGAPWEAASQPHGRNNPPCPNPSAPAIPMSVAQLQSRVDFHVVTLVGRTLVGSMYAPPCSGSMGYVLLGYKDDGESIELRESPAAAGPVQVELTGPQRSSWTIVTVDGNDYAVGVINGSVVEAVFKRAGTRVDFQVGEQDVSKRMSLAQFEELVRNMN